MMLIIIAHQHKLAIDLVVGQVRALMPTSEAAQLGFSIEVGDVETEPLDVSSRAEVISAGRAQT